MSLTYQGVFGPLHNGSPGGAAPGPAGPTAKGMAGGYGFAQAHPVGPGDNADIAAARAALEPHMALITSLVGNEASRLGIDLSTATEEDFLSWDDDDVSALVDAAARAIRWSSTTAAPSPRPPGPSTWGGTQGAGIAHFKRGVDGDPVYPDTPGWWSRPGEGYHGEGVSCFGACAGPSRAAFQRGLDGEPVLPDIPGWDGPQGPGGPGCGLSEVDDAVAFLQKHIDRVPDEYRPEMDHILIQGFAYECDHDDPDGFAGYEPSRPGTVLFGRPFGYSKWADLLGPRKFRAGVIAHELVHMIENEQLGTYIERGSSRLACLPGFPPAATEHRGAFVQAKVMDASNCHAEAFGCFYMRHRCGASTSKNVLSTIFRILACPGFVVGVALLAVGLAAAVISGGLSILAGLLSASFGPVLVLMASVVADAVT